VYCANQITKAELGRDIDGEDRHIQVKLYMMTARAELLERIHAQKDRY
jgi:hypothetical protein